MPDQENPSPAAAVENLLEKYRAELGRLEGTKKGLEQKIASTRAKMEGLEEALKAVRPTKAQRLEHTDE
jgi:phage shock protein A